MMDKDIRDKIDLLIKECMGKGIKEGELFEEFNKKLSKHVGKQKGKTYRKKAVCRPVLMISDSSCDEG